MAVVALQLWALAKAARRVPAVKASLTSLEDHVQVSYALMQQSVLQRHVIRVCPLAEQMMEDLAADV
jgi:hypothetical protein